LSNLWAQHPSEVVHGEREDANALTAPLKPSTTARFDALAKDEDVTVCCAELAALVSRPRAPAKAEASGLQREPTVRCARRLMRAAGP
jgi:hypothetical protein